jgi:hypothetical protein
VADVFAAFEARAGVDAVDDGTGERRCFDVVDAARGDWTGVSKALDCVDACSDACTTGVADVAWERTLACVSLLQQPQPPRALCFEWHPEPHQRPACRQGHEDFVLIPPSCAEGSQQPFLAHLQAWDLEFEEEPLTSSETRFNDTICCGLCEL